MIGAGKAAQQIYAQIADYTIANSNVAASIFNDTGARGSRIIKANTLNVGDVIRVHALGIWGNTGTPTATLAVKFGAVTLVSDAGATTNQGSGLIFEFNFLLTVRAIGTSGKVSGGGLSMIKSPGISSSGLFRMLLLNTDVTIDTNVDNLLDATYQWSVASSSNSITIRNSLIEKI